MVKLNNFTQQQASFNNSQSTDSQNQFSEPSQQANQQPPNQPKGLFSLPTSVMQIVPWIPFALEAMTGQKIPAIGGTIGEIQSALQQLQINLTQILNNQQQIWSKLEALEKNASNQLTNLSQQVASTNNSFRLLATETKKSLEFNPRPKPELATNSYEEPEYV